MILTKLYKEYFSSEKAGGLLLIAATALSLVLANSAWQTSYIQIWNTDLAGHSIVHWINDGLMAIFFLLIGLELERELYRGELSNIKNATLPIFGALGGMLIPAGIFLLFTFGTVAQPGVGIPMGPLRAIDVGSVFLMLGAYAIMLGYDPLAVQEREVRSLKLKADLCPFTGLEAHALERLELLHWPRHRRINVLQK